MEVKGAQENKLRVFLLELLGSFLFISAASMGNYKTIPFSLFASILIFGNVTGGHFNPAVSLGVYIKERKYGQNIVMLLLLWTA